MSRKVVRPCRCCCQLSQRGVTLPEKMCRFGKGWSLDRFHNADCCWCQLTMYEMFTSIAIISQTCDKLTSFVLAIVIHAPSCHCSLPVSLRPLRCSFCIRINHLKSSRQHIWCCNVLTFLGIYVICANSDHDIFKIGRLGTSNIDWIFPAYGLTALYLRIKANFILKKKFSFYMFC